MSKRGRGEELDISPIENWKWAKNSEFSFQKETACSRVIILGREISVQMS
jgi:hypothetical protein